jgi:SSS family solute:Na+ symporter
VVPGWIRPGTVPVSLSTGSVRLDAAVNLLLVALLAVTSYPSHDPVLTDRGFVNAPRTLLRADLGVDSFGGLFCSGGPRARTRAVGGGKNPSGFKGLVALLRRVASRAGGLALGRRMMLVFAVVGNLPLFWSADDLEATTVSGNLLADGALFGDDLYALFSC